MSNQDCACCGSADASTAEIPEPATVAVADVRDDARDRPLPDALAERLRAAHRLDATPATVGEWTDGLRERARDLVDWPPGVRDLCVTDSARHEAAFGDRREQFHCTLDALLVPFLVGQPATVRSASPVDGTLVTVDVDDDTATVHPGDAVLSLGAADVNDGDGFEWDTAIQGLCAYGNAFPSRAAYEDWADGVDAETTAIPLAEGVGLAADLVA